MNCTPWELLCMAQAHGDIFIQNGRIQVPKTLPSDLRIQMGLRYHDILSIMREFDISRPDVVAAAEKLLLIHSSDRKGPKGREADPRAMAHLAQWQEALGKSSASLAVLDVIARHANREGEASCSLARLGMDAKLPKNVILESLRFLETNGAIDIVRTRGKANVYNLNYEPETGTNEVKTPEALSFGF